MAIPIPVDLDRCAPGAAGGFLTGACPLPESWERGISFLDTACLTPTVMGECPTCPPGLKETQRADTATFRPVSLIQAFECSTLGGVAPATVASAALDETADYALARELLTGQASARDANPNTATGAVGNPSLQCAAVSLGAGFVDPIAAIGALEQAIADATGGRRGYVFMGPEVALASWEVLRSDVGRLTTLTGTRVIVDGGFDGRAPGCDESPGCEPWNTTGAPAFGEDLWIYATAGVWAGVGRGVLLDSVNRANNTAEARDERIALAAFTPCATFAASSGIPKTY